MKKMSSLLALLMIVLMLSIAPVHAAEADGEVAPLVGASLTVVTPDGGEFISGNYDITFARDNFAFDVKTEFARLSDTGAASCEDVLDWETTNSNIRTTGTTSNWVTTTATTPDGADYCVRVSNVVGDIEDFSNDVFTIDNTPPEINSVSAVTVQEGNDVITVLFDETNALVEGTVEDDLNWDIESPDDTNINFGNAVFAYDSGDNELTITLDESTDNEWLKNGNVVCVTPTSDVKDLAGNSIATTEVCSDLTITGDVDASTATLSFRHENGATSAPFPTGVLTITANFDEDIDPDVVVPQISIDRDGSANDVTDGDMVIGADRETWTFDYTIQADNGADVLDDLTVDVTINSGEDLAGNPMNPETETFAVDTINPEVTSVDVSDDLLAENDVGDTFTVTVDYNELMSSAVAPTFTFDPDVSTTLVSCSGSWTDDDTYVHSCTVADDNETLTGDDVTVEDAQDLAGNVQVEETGLGLDQFNVDTQEPVGTLSVTGLPVFENDLRFVVTINYNEDMKGTSSPTIVFNTTGITTAVAGAWDVTGRIWTEEFDLASSPRVDTAVTVSSSGALDLADNVQEIAEATFDVDTVKPTVTAVSDTTFLFDDRGDTVTVTVTFDEVMDETVFPTVVEGGVNAPGFTLNNIDWLDSTHLTFDYLIPNLDHGLLADTRFVVSGAEDFAGNVMTSYETATTIDTNDPTASVTLGVDPVTEANNVQTVTFVYSEAMNPAIDPVISFSGNTGAITSNGDGDWSSGNTVWTETFDVADADEQTAVVTVTSSGARDVSGNVESANAVDDNTFAIDTKKPVGTVTVDTATIYEGDLIQNVTVTYSEAMNPTTSPTILFSAGTITPRNVGTWVANNIWVQKFDVADLNQEIEVEVSTSGATDVVGNVEDASDNAFFDVDTKQPTVSSATASPDPAGAGTVTITVDFSEDMDTGMLPTVTVTGLTVPTYTMNSDDTFTDSNTWVGTFLLADDDEVATATITVNGAEDVAGNLMDLDATHTFEVDTVDPVDAGPAVAPNPVVQGMEAVFTGTVTDNSDLAAARVHVLLDGNEVTDSPFSMDAADGFLGHTEEDVMFTADGTRTATWTAGVYSFWIEGQDSAGNWQGQTIDNTDTFVVIEESPFYTREEVDVMVDALEANISGTVASISQLESVTVGLRTDVDTLSGRINSNDADIDDLGIALGALTTRVSVSEGDIDSIEGTLSTHAAAIAALEELTSNLDGNVTEILATLALLGTQVDGLQTDLTALTTFVDLLEDDLEELMDAVDDFFAFEVADTTASAFTYLDEDVTITAETNLEAVCEVYDQFGDLVGEMDSGVFDEVVVEVLGSQEHSMELIMSSVSVGTNPYEIKCTASSGTRSFSKRVVASFDYFESFVLNKPDNERGFGHIGGTENPYAFWMSKIVIDLIDDDVVESADDDDIAGVSAEYMLFGGLSSLTSNDVKVLWSYNVQTGGWDSYRPDAEVNTFTRFDAVLGYYVLQYRSSAIGKFVRHAIIETEEV